MSVSDADGRIRILVVDDEEAICRMICRSNADHELYAFAWQTSAPEALECVKRRECDLLLTDINMPEMDGYELTESVLAFDPYLPVIALTAHGQDPAVEIRCLQAGARYFLGKPFDNGALLAAIDAVYKQARRERDKAGMLRHIRESRDFMQSILENTTDIVFVKDRDLRYVTMNRVGLEIFNISAQEIRGLTDADILPAATAELVREADQQVLREGASVEVTEVVNVGNGSRVFSVKKFPLREKSGAIWAVCGIARDITERLRAQNAVEEQLQFLQVLMDTMPAMVYHKDTEGTYVGCNLAFAEAFGTPREEVCGSMPEALFPPEQAKVIRQRDRELFAAPGPQAFELRMAHADDETRDILFNRTTYTHADGELAGIVGVGLDITDRKRLETDLQEKEEMLRSVFSAVQVGVCVTDEEGRFVGVNDNYCNIYGYSQDELIGESFLKVVPEANHAWVQEMYRNFLLDDAPEIPTEWRVLRKDGTSIDVWVTAGLLRHQDGRSFKVTTIRDITEEKAIRRDREIYAQAFHHSLQGVTITDLSGKILHVNDSFARLYGYATEEVVGKTPRVLNPGKEVYRDFGIDEAEYERIFSGMWSSISDPAVGEWKGDIINRRKDGSVFWAQLFISAIRDDRGNPIAYVGMPMDISDLRARADAERVEFYHALAELAEARDNETGMHLRRIGAYASAMAEYLGRPRKYVTDIEALAPLHDVGKVGIADEILLAPRRLTPEEFETMKTHATLGYDIMRGREALQMGAEIAYGHHEKWDGSGYPQGIGGEEIPFAARIVAVCDVYDALRSERPYKEAWPHERAAEVIREGRGKHFDPAMVDAFEALEHRFARITDAMRDEDEPA